MKTTIVFAALILTGCATSQETYTESGRPGYTIDCSGTARNWGMCYEKAGNICRERGYDIVAGGSDQDAAIVVSNGNAAGHVKNNRSMVIQCKD